VSSVSRCGSRRLFRNNSVILAVYLVIAAYNMVIYADVGARQLQHVPFQISRAGALGVTYQKAWYLTLCRAKCKPLIEGNFIAAQRSRWHLRYGELHEEFVAVYCRLTP
jgi:hypothetical protein